MPSSPPKRSAVTGTDARRPTKMSTSVANLDRPRRKTDDIGIPPRPGREWVGLSGRARLETKTNGRGQPASSPGRAGPGPSRSCRPPMSLAALGKGALFGTSCGTIEGHSGQRHSNPRGCIRSRRRRLQGQNYSRLCHHRVAPRRGACLRSHPASAIHAVRAEPGREEGTIPQVGTQPSGPHTDLLGGPAARTAKPT